MLEQGWGPRGEWGDKPDPARATPTPQEDSIRAVMVDTANAPWSKKDNACTWKMMQFCPDPMRVSGKAGRKGCSCGFAP